MPEASCDIRSSGDGQPVPCGGGGGGVPLGPNPIGGGGGGGGGGGAVPGPDPKEGGGGGGPGLAPGGAAVNPVNASWSSASAVSELIGEGGCSGVGESATGGRADDGAGESGAVLPSSGESVGTGTLGPLPPLPARSGSRSRKLGARPNGIGEGDGEAERLSLPLDMPVDDGVSGVGLAGARSSSVNGAAEGATRPVTGEVASCSGTDKVGAWTLTGSGRAT